MNFHPFDQDASETIWYDMYSLNFVDLDDQANAEGIRLIAEVSRQALDNTDFDITEDSTYSYNDNRFDATYMADARVYGLTVKYPTNSNPMTHKVIYLNTNNNVNYLTGTGCNIFTSDVSASYIINHEFGHFAGLGHHGWTWSSTDTAMKEGCNSGQAQLRVEDINDINDHYN